MEKLIWPIIILFALIGIFYKAKDKKTENIDDAYYKKEFLLTIPERKFFEVLQKLLPSNYICFPQMVISNILSVKAKGKYYIRARNKINKKTIDFVIFEKEYLRPVLAIEYDDKKHESPRGRKRDKTVNEALGQSNLDIVHIKYSQNNLEEVIKNEIMDKLNLNYEISKR